MTGKLLSSVAFLTTIFALQNAQSAEVPQALTIDRLSAETADFLNSSEIASPYELQTVKAGETDVVVRIGGTTYYFTPANAEQGASLQTLADIGSAALKELPDSTGAVYKLGDKYYGYDAQKLPKSAYSLSEISKAEAESASYPVITKYIRNDDNTLSEKYYRVDVKQPENGRKVYDTRQDALSGQGDIDADFIGSSYTTSSDTAGGAISNSDNSMIGNITGDFINNYAKSTYSSAGGGAIYNDSSSTIGNITGDFINNYAQGESANGGAIYNEIASTIGNITGDFINNYAQGESAIGGAIYNEIDSTIGNITGNFIGNYAQGKSVGGGTIANIESSTIGNIIGDFIGNYAQGTSVEGGTIANGYDSTIGNITGNFINNHAQGTSSEVDGGVILNYGTIGNITGDFINNHAQSESSVAYGGAIANAEGSAIGNITGDFIGNYAQVTGESSEAWGGAIVNIGTIKNILNSNFIGNYVKGNEDSAGGAILSASDILITADAGTSLFSGNKANDKSNAIYMFGWEDMAIDLNLSAVNKGTITFDDGIDGSNYNINVTGDGSGEIALNNLVENATALTIDNTTLRLGTKGNVNAENISGNGTIKVDVTFADNNKIQTGVINAADNLTGDYKVIANPVNDGNADYVGASSVFLTAPNDEAAFDLARVIGSPYVWDIDKGNTDSGYSWSLELVDYISKNQTIVPEVIAGAGLHEAAIEQTRSVVRNVRTKVADGRVYCPGCGLYDYAWNNQQLRNVWVLAQGESATIDKPVKTDADIWGVEAGFDIQNDVNNTLGVFASYRKGEYDLSGKADKVRSNIGSEIDIDSYLAGLYYRYDKNMNWLFATVYGGVQQADAKTDDGIAKFDTDGIEFGAAVEAGHTFALSSDLTLDPSLGLYYTQINFDDAKDNVGKEYDWKDVKHLEAELGVKLEKQIDAAKVYVKPSVIQTITSGDSVKITGLNKLSTYDDQTLGRIELGGRYGFTDALSAYGWVNYTFGSDYDATAFGAGLNYSW